MYIVYGGVDTAKKAQFNVSISEELEREFREFVARKHKRAKKGLISYEVEEALRYWMALHTRAQMTLVDTSVNPPLDVSRVFIQIKEYLITHYYPELGTGQVININHLKEAIMRIRGSDPRTINKWIKTFKDLHLIKPIAGVMWEIL
jgi:uncharacterized protein YcgI (DUF1989 family)